MESPNIRAERPAGMALFYTVMDEMENEVADPDATPIVHEIVYGAEEKHHTLRINLCMEIRRYYMDNKNGQIAPRDEFIAGLQSDNANLDLKNLDLKEENAFLKNRNSDLEYTNHKLGITQSRMRERLNETEKDQRIDDLMVALDRAENAKLKCEELIHELKIEKEQDKEQFEKRVEECKTETDLIEKVLHRVQKLAFNMQKTIIWAVQHPRQAHTYLKHHYPEFYVDVDESDPEPKGKDKGKSASVPNFNADLVVPLRETVKTITEQPKRLAQVVYFGAKKGVKKVVYRGEQFKRTCLAVLKVAQKVRAIKKARKAAREARAARHAEYAAMAATNFSEVAGDDAEYGMGYDSQRMAAVDTDVGNSSGRAGVPSVPRPQNEANVVEGSSSRPPVAPVGNSFGRTWVQSVPRVQTTANVAKGSSSRPPMAPAN